MAPQAASVEARQESIILSFADYLVERWKRLGVTTVFGVPGSAVGPLLERVLRDDTLRFVMARHESGAVAMADGYARVSGRLGVAMVTAGPGALNALPHLVVADTDNSPVLLVTGDVARRHGGRRGIQDSSADGVRIDDAFTACVGFSRRLSHAASAPRLLENAVRHALTAPRGAAHLSIPVDLYAEEVPAAGDDDGADRFRPGTPVWDTATGAASTGAVLELLLGARHPLVLLGNGARDALTGGPAAAGLLARLRAFSDEFAVPVGTTTKGKGLFPERDATALGVVSIGGSARARSYLDGRPDVVVVVGSSLGEWATRNWTPDLRGTAAFAQVDVDPATIGRTYRVDQAIVADAGAFLRTLLGSADAVDRAVDRAAGRSAVDARRAVLARLPVAPWHRPGTRPDALPARPQEVVREVATWLRSDEERIVLLDVGNLTGWFTQQVPVGAGTRVLLPWGVASMGWANAAVIGAKIAAPDATCVTLTGDGGFLMNAVEIATAAHRRIGALWLVVQDDAFNMVRQGMLHSYPHSYDQEREDFGLGAPDLAALAESLGADAHRVGYAIELGPVLAKAEQAARDRERPQVICVPIDRDQPSPFEDRHDGVARAFTAARGDGAPVGSSR